MPTLKKELLQEVHLLVKKEENSIISFFKNQNDHLLTEVNFLHEEVREKNMIMDNCRQNINCDISNNKKPFSTDDGDKSQKPIKDSIVVNSFTRNFEFIRSSRIFPPNLVNAKKANPSKVHPFIAVRPRKGDHFSKTPNQDDNEYNKSNCDSDKKY